MIFLELISTAVSLVQALSELAVHVSKTAPRIRALLGVFANPVTYENLSFEFRLEIKDARGERAVLIKRQRVCFRLANAGLVRDLAWGDGQLMDEYEPRVRAHLVCRTKEGARRSYWRQIGHPPKVSS